MRLKNKKTGEVIDSLQRSELILDYTSLAELNEEWTDAPEEQKRFYWLDYNGDIYNTEIGTMDRSEIKEIGNYFESKEEAELAVRKLKAWKRLKDKGFKFDHIRSIDGVSINHKDLGQYTIIAYADEDGCDQECLDLLFSGGEE